MNYFLKYLYTYIILYYNINLFVTVLVSLFMLLVCSLFGTITFWCTNFFDQVVLTVSNYINPHEKCSR